MKTIWLYGPSGCGKTTIGKEVVNQLIARGRRAVLIDGDELRRTICSNLGFSYDDRLRQTTMAAHMAKAVTTGNAWAVVCLITPYEEFRTAARRITKARMIYLSSSMQTRIDRDPKGLYAKAIAGELGSKLTGYDGDFDEPDMSDTYATDDGITPEEIALRIVESSIGSEFRNGDGI